MEDGKTEPKRESIYTFPLLVLALVSFVGNVDAAIQRGVLPLIGEYFSVSDRELGLLGFAFIFLNVLASIPAGWIADNYRRGRVIGYTIASWSALSALSAAAFNYPSLLVARGVMGFGEALADPAATSLIGDYFPPYSRGRGFSVQQVMFFVGQGVGLALAGYIGSRLGWRWAFLLVGMPGSLVAIMAFRLREPKRGEADLDSLKPRSENSRIPSPNSERSPHEGQGDKTMVGPRHSQLSDTFEAAGETQLSGSRKLEDPPTLGLWPFLRYAAADLIREIIALLRIRTMRYILIGAATLLFTVQGIGYWLAVFHQRYSRMSLTKAATVTAGILGVAGIIGTFWGGSFADRLLSKKGYAARIDMSVAMILGGAAAFFVSWIVSVVWVSIAFQFAGVVLIATVPPTLRASVMDVVPASSRGVGTSAFALVTAVFGTALAPAVVGLLSDLTHSLRRAFILVSPPIVAGSLILWRARFTIVQDAQQMLALLASQGGAKRSKH